MAEDPRPEVTDRFRLNSGSAVSVGLFRIMPVTTAVPPDAASAAPSPAAPPAPGPAAPASPPPEIPSLDVAPGSVVRVRDEDWLVGLVLSAGRHIRGVLPRSLALRARGAAQRALALNASVEGS